MCNNPNPQAPIFTLLAFLVALLTGMLVFPGAPDFQPYLGKIPPLSAILIAWLPGLALIAIIGVYGKNLQMIK